MCVKIIGYLIFNSNQVGVCVLNAFVINCFDENAWAVNILLVAMLEIPGVHIWSCISSGRKRVFPVCAAIYALKQ